MVNRASPCNGLGDIDQDGYVTEADAQLALKIAVGSYKPTAEEFRRADVDRNNVVLSSDGLYILRYAQGLIDTFPGCTGESHRECRGSGCETVPGPGENTCYYQDDCGHQECVNQECKRVPGKGAHTCDANRQCPTVKPKPDNSMLKIVLVVGVLGLLFYISK